MFRCSNFSVTDIPELQASNYGLSESETYPTEGLLFGHANNQAKLIDVTDYLKKVYCNTVAVDFTAVENENEYEWLCQEYEKLTAGETSSLSPEDKKILAKEMLK